MTEEPVIHGENALELCDSCKAQNHRGHTSTFELSDGTLAACECCGECDDSFVWPPPESGLR